MKKKYVTKNVAFWRQGSHVYRMTSAFAALALPFFGKWKLSTLPCGFNYRRKSSKPPLSIIFERCRRHIETLKLVLFIAIELFDFSKFNIWQL